jgi:hypothetical protein
MLFSDICRKYLCACLCGCAVVCHLPVGRLKFPLQVTLLHIKNRSGKFLYNHVFKCFIRFFNTVVSFIAVTKLDVLDHILFYAILNLYCLRGEGAVPVHWLAIAPTCFLHSAQAPPSGFSTKLLGYNSYAFFLEYFPTADAFGRWIWCIMILSLYKCYTLFCEDRMVDLVCNCMSIYVVQCPWVQHSFC